MKRKIAVMTLLLLSLDLVLNPFCNVFANEPKEEVDKRNCFDYALFSGSEKEDIIINSALVDIKGSLHSNNSIKVRGAEIKVNGNVEWVKDFENGFGSSKIENTKERDKAVELKDITKIIKEKIEKEAEIYKGDTKITNNELKSDKPILVEGNMDIKENDSKLKNIIYATENINLTTSLLGNEKDKKSIICSEKGNITLNGSDTEIYGSLYAPNGKIKINGSRVKINGRVIAKAIEYNGSIFNINASKEDFDLINDEPVIDAGKDLVVFIKDKCNLNATAKDDGILLENLDVQWKKLKGPGEVEFDNEKELNTEAKFSKAGNYELELTVSDGRYEVKDKVNIKVKDKTIENVNLNVGGNLKENRKVILDFSKIKVDKRFPLNKDKTTFKIIPLDKGINDKDIKEDKENLNHLIRKVIFKKSGNYKVYIKLVNDNEEVEFEKNIKVSKDENPIADFQIENNKYYRNSKNNEALITLKDKSHSIDNDKIKNRFWKVYYDSDNDGEFSDEKVENINSENLVKCEFKTNRVGKYKVSLECKEVFNDTINKFISDEDYKKGNTDKKNVKETTFEVLNKEPKAKLDVEKAKNTDIVVTLGETETEKVDKIDKRLKEFKKVLKEKGIKANISTVSTSSITAKDTFAWEEYDHCDYNQYYGPTYKKHITMDDKNIKMMGYTENPLKDFLYIQDNSKMEKTFTFDMKRDQNNWHTLEGGGFLFNTTIDKKNKTIEGYCILITKDGLKLDKINKVNLDSFRNGSYQLVQHAGQCLKTFPINNIRGNHKIKIIVTNKKISLWDNGNLIIDKYELPNQNTGSGFGPITSHVSHSCSQESYFTFNNIKMESVSGKSLQEALNKYKWTLGAERFLINLSDKNIEDLKNIKLTNNVATTIIKKNLNFIALGNKVNKNEYENLINILGDSSFYINNENMDSAIDKLEKYILDKLEKKDYKKNIVLGEEVTYSGYYEDVENDPIYEEKWKYTHDSSIYENQLGSISNNGKYVNKKINIFDKVGSYDISMSLRDNPVGKNDNLDIYRKWSKEVGVNDKIIVHRKPVVKITALALKNGDSKKTSNLKFSEDSYDLDNISKENKGITEKEIWWKNIKDSKWTKGNIPSKLPLNEDFLIKMRVKDLEGEFSNTEAIFVTTRGIVSEDEIDNQKPTIKLVLNKDTVNIGDEVEVKVIANDNDKIKKITFKVEGQEVKLNKENKYKFKANKVGKIKLEAFVEDASGNSNNTINEIKVRDNIAPKGEIIIDNSKPYIGQDVNVKINCSDNIGLEKVELKLNDKLLKLNSDNTFKYEVKDLKKLSFEAILYDKEGNKSAATSVVIPQKDSIKPSVKIISPKDRLEKNEKINIKVDGKDNAKLEKIDVTVNGQKIELKDNSFELFAKKEGKYEIKVLAIDKSGNKTEVTKEIIVEIPDKLAPKGKIIVDNKEPYVGSEVNIKIEATDDNILKRRELKINGEKVKLDSNSYKYRIETEKEIKIELYLEDIAGNTAYGHLEIKAKKEEVKPTINLKINKEKLDINEESQMYIGAKDNAGIKEVKAFINEKEVKVENNKIVFKESKKGDYKIKVIAKDFSGNSNEITKIIKVYDSSELNFNVNLNGDKIIIGSDLLVKIDLRNEDKLKKLQCNINGKDVELIKEKNNLYTYKLKISKIEKLNISVCAIDITNNIIKVSKEVLVIASDKAPEIDLKNYGELKEITEATDIIGTAKDDDLVFYRVEISPKGKEKYSLIHEGKESVDNGKLCTIDPTLLQNGLYDIRLIAEDSIGNKVILKDAFKVKGDMKIGNFTLGFQDMNIPVGKLPITITRNYDSRDKISNDFGVGWKLGLNNLKLEILNPIGEGWAQKSIQSGWFPTYRIYETQKHRVLITFPNGKVEEFSIKLNPQSQQMVPIRYTKVGFEALNGSDSTLKVLGQDECNVVGQTLGSIGDVYLSGGSISSKFKPTKFELKTKDGVRYIISEKNGVEKIIYPNSEYIIINNEGVIHSSGKKVIFDRDGNNGNRIKSITDFNGKKVNYKYDEDGNLKEVIDIKANSTKFNYNNNHGLIDIINANGVRVTKNEYDENGRLTGYIDANGNKTEYSFNKDEKQYVVKDRLGNIEIYNYDQNGNVVSHIDKENNKTQYIYDENNNLKKEIDPLGNEYIYEYDKDDNLLSKTNPYKEKVVGTYNEYGEVLTMKALDGNIISAIYDKSGLLKEVKNPLGDSKKLEYTSLGRISKITDEIGQVKKFSYDSKGNPISMTDENGNVTNFVYDKNGKCISKSTQVTGKNGKKVITTNFNYDKKGNLVSATDSKGNRTKFEYDNIGNLISSTDKNNNKTQYSYDVFGNITKVIYPDGTFESFSYDKEGNNISSTDVNGKIINYSYDKMGRMTKKSYPNGLNINYTYDAKGQVIKVEDSKGDKRSYKYDKLGRNTEVVDALNNVTKFEYGKDKKVTKVIDSNNNVTEYKYDKLGRCNKIIFSNKTNVSLEYDKLGRIIKKVDLNGEGTSYQYDKVGNLIKVTDPNNNSTEYKYDENKNLIEEKDSNGHATKYLYDELGRVSERILPLGEKESYKYDGNGNIISKTEFDGKTKKYTYNSNNLVASKTLSDGSRVDYKYNKYGLIEEIKNKEGTTKYNYDISNNLTSKVMANGEKIEYTYDLKGNTKSIKTKNTNTKYNYDILGRLVKVTDKDNNETTFKYDKVGNLVQKVNFNGVKTEYKYDKLYRLIKLININSKGQVISEYNYKLNNQGYRTEIIDNKGRKTEYQYDKCGYLLKEKITNGKNITETNYKYDKVGNRIEKNTNGKTIKYIYDDNNRLISEDDIKYSYDSNGNLKKKESKDEIVELEYNLEGKLSKLTKTKGKTEDVESYKYNELGIRIQKNTNGTIINYIVDENTEYPRVLEERDKDGKLLVSYSYGNSLVSQNRNNVISVYLKDGLGSTVALTNNKGEVTDTYLYDAFGNIIEKSGETENNYLFAGEQKDKLSGQYYLRARYLDTKIGRFTSMDSYLGSIQDPTSLHKYLYANSNPVNYIDPSGNISLMDQIASTRIYSILASIGSRSVSIFVKVNETFIGRYVIEVAEDTVLNLVDGNITEEEVIVSLVTGAIEATLGGIDIPSASKISKSAQGSGGSGGVDFIATSNGTAVHASQTDMINSITNAGATRIGPTSQTSEIGEIFQMNTKYGPMEIRVMPGQTGTTSAFKGPRTINTIPGTGTYVYPNGERIIGAVSKSDRKLIGHIHGQRP